MADRRETETGKRVGATPLPEVLLGLIAKEDLPVRSDALKELSRIVIPHRNFQSGIGSLARIHDAYDEHSDAEAGFLLLRGQPRSGKTHMLKFYKRHFPPAKGETGWVRPVLYIRAPARGGSHGLLRAILSGLQVQVLASRKGFELLEDVERHLRAQRVELLILDEFQHVIDGKTDNYSYQAADILKNFLSMNACQFVFSGLDISLEVLAVNHQFDGRKAAEFEMAPYNWLSEEEQGHYLDYLAELADQTVELGMFSVRPALDGLALGRRIHCAADGLVGLTSRLVRSAADIALRAEAATITVEHLRKAFDMLKRVGVTTNPFVAAGSASNTSPPEDLVALVSERMAQTNLRKRKGRTPRASFSR